MNDAVLARVGLDKVNVRDGFVVLNLDSLELILHSTVNTASFIDDAVASFIDAAVLDCTVMVQTMWRDTTGDLSLLEQD